MAHTRLRFRHESEVAWIRFGAKISNCTCFSWYRLECIW